ncbi:hypothetical protein NE857_14685 [Nocardiopsis exhalans]|uniref:Uncharacterized protein n=1 Tax=Nocardiopsis exhalans TaxID=163604 RepID=A0ABY5DEH5_9ACTN|nr:hypothetical protein [Nocardiopsis exhalans]USY22742.1 hypothetical protein NE857_14685 [Nocardiopsis exhalans]
MAQGTFGRPALPRFAVSTLGAPGRSLKEVVRLAHAAGARALELRAGAGEAADPALGPAELGRRRALVEAHGMRVLAVASYVRVAAEGDDAEVVADLAEHEPAPPAGAGGWGSFLGRSR